MRNWRLALPLSLLASACLPNSALDRDQVRATIERNAGVGGSPVTVERIYLSGDYALGLWSQGSRRGDMVLARRSGQWAQLLCGNGPIRDQARLKRAGVPDFAAEMLVSQIAEGG